MKAARSLRGLLVGALAAGIVAALYHARLLDAALVAVRTNA